jgi:hypothetical protein
MGEPFVRPRSRLPPLRQAWPEQPQPAPAARTRYKYQAPRVKPVVKPPPVEVFEEEQVEACAEVANLLFKVEKFREDILSSDAERLMFTALYSQHQQTKSKYVTINSEVYAENLALHAENLALKQQIREITEVIEKDLECPISHELFRDPVMLRDGHTYERKNIEAWFARPEYTSPMTREIIRRSRFVPNRIVRKMIKALKLE